MKRPLKALVFAALLAGCAPPPRMPFVPHPHRTWAAHRRKLRAIRGFRLAAQGGVRSGGHGGSLLLHWIVTPAASQMTGYGPFGRLIFRLRARPGAARLVTERGRFRGADAKVLLARATGWRLPVSGLRYWILGVPAPGSSARTRIDRAGLLASLRQAGWSIRYRRYELTRWGRLPRVLVLRRPRSGRLPRIVVTLRIERWLKA